MLQEGTTDVETNVLIQVNKLWGKLKLNLPTINALTEEQTKSILALYSDSKQLLHFDLIERNYQNHPALFSHL